MDGEGPGVDDVPYPRDDHQAKVGGTMEGVRLSLRENLNQNNHPKKQTPV